MAASRIEWTEATWNPSTGCDRISTGCDHCFALTLAKRLKAMGSSKYQTDGDPRTSGPGFGVAFHPDAAYQPLRWRTPKKIFVNSMSDLAHARISDEQIATVFAVMALTTHHQYQLLTKRPKRLAKLLARNDFLTKVADAATQIATTHAQTPTPPTNMPWPLPNVWLGTTIETDDYCWRADELRKAPAALRFLSCEPLLGPLPSLNLADIDWLIAGGESGPGHRPLNLDWVRQLRDQCQAESVPLFFKQVGGLRPKDGGRHLDGRTWDQFPHQPRTPVGSTQG